MDGSQKPKEKSIDWLKKFMADASPLPRWVEPEPGFKPQEFKQLAFAAETDYKSLCEVLGLKPVQLDLYLPNGASDETTPIGTPMSNFTPGYDGTKEVIALPVVPGTHTLDLKRGLAFPPASWDYHHPDWPRWRSDLWHEAFHQVEKHIFGTWDGRRKEHGESYLNAVQYAARKLSSVIKVTPQDLQILALLNTEKPLKPTSTGSPKKDVRELIRKRAYELFEERGKGLGRELDDWLQAEREIKNHLGL
jgi:hypothetical protein